MLICSTDDSWIARQDYALDGEPYWVESEHPSIPFIQAYNEWVGFDRGQESLVGTLEDIGNLENVPSFPPNIDASTLVSVDATNPNPTGSSLHQTYHTSGETLPWTNGSQWGVHEAASPQMAHGTYHAPLLSNPRHGVVEPDRLEFFNPYRGLWESDGFMEPSSRWVPLASLGSTPRGYPQVSEVASISTSRQDYQDITAEQTEMLRPVDAQLPEPPFPSIADLPEFNTPQQGTDPYKGSAYSTQKVWLGGITSDATPHFEDHTAVNHETSYQPRGTSKNATNETSISINDLASNLVPVACTAITEATRRSKAPNADLTLVIGGGKPAASKVRKAFSKGRRQEVAGTRQVGAYFRCRLAKDTVGFLDYE